MLSKCLTQTSSFLTTWRLGRLCINFASNDWWQRGICAKRAIAPMTFLWGINDKLHKANHDSSVASNIKSVWLGFTFELGVGAPFRPTCFDGYTVFSPRVIKLSDLVMLFDNDIANREIVYGIWHGFCIGWRPMAKDLLLLWNSFKNQ